MPTIYKDKSFFELFEALIIIFFIQSVCAGQNEYTNDKFKIFFLEYYNNIEHIIVGVLHR